LHVRISVEARRHLERIEVECVSQPPNGTGTFVSCLLKMFDDVVTIATIGIPKHFDFFSQGIFEMFLTRTYLTGEFLSAELRKSLMGYPMRPDFKPLRE